MNSSLKRRVMARIYLRFARNVVVEYPDYIMFFLFMVFSFSFISFRNVLSNIPKDSLMAAFNFFVEALKHTHWIIKSLILGFFVRSTVTGAVLAYKSIRNMDASWLSKLTYGRSDTENNSL